VSTISIIAFTASPLLMVISVLMMRMARLHGKLANLNQLVADMLRADANPRQVQLARAEQARHG
jgi:hypothetical protein